MSMKKSEHLSYSEDAVNENIQEKSVLREDLH